jgi:hypothetical protein
MEAAMVCTAYFDNSSQSARNNYAFFVGFSGSAVTGTKVPARRLWSDRRSRRLGVKLSTRTPLAAFLQPRHLLH